MLVYHNPERKNTYGVYAAKPYKYILDTDVEISASEISATLAERIRQREFQRIDVWLKQDEDLVLN